jgi:hypothetical protein
VARIGFGSDGIQYLLHAGRVPQEQGQDNRLFVRKVVVDRCLADPGLFGDLANRSRRISLPGNRRAATCRIV